MNPDKPKTEINRVTPPPGQLATIFEGRVRFSSTQLALDFFTYLAGGVLPVAWSETPPEAADSPGTAGQYASDGSYFYICTADNQWAYIPLATNFPPP
jgi:hypothetical protein